MTPVVWPDDVTPAERSDVLAEVARRAKIGINGTPPIFVHAANRWYETRAETCGRCGARRTWWRVRGGHGHDPCPQCEPLAWARVCVESCGDSIASDVARAIGSFSPDARMQVAIALMAAGDEPIAVEVAVRADAALASGALDAGPPHPRSPSAWESWRKRDLATLLAGRVVRGMRLASTMLVQANEDAP